MFAKALKEFNFNVKIEIIFRFLTVERKSKIRSPISPSSSFASTSNVYLLQRHPVWQRRDIQTIK
jgi:hypothetical protein